MARTPLASSLRTLWRDLTRARAQGIPVDELADRAAARPRPSRREVLAGAAAGAALLAAPGRARAAAADPTVAIIGGGIAGLSCALTLLDKGVESTVYEASGRVGGRMYSNRTGYWSAGQISEWGGELIDTGHATVQDLAARFGLPVDDLFALQPAGSDEVYRVLGGYYPRAQANADFDAIFAAVKADLRAAPFPTTWDAYTAAGATLDALSAYDWIESRIPGGHASPLGAMLDLAYAIEYGADTTQQSSLNLLYLLAYQPKPYDHTLAVFGESDERYHIRGGNQRLPEAIAAYLGDRVVTGEKLVRLKETAGGRYKLSFERGNQTIDRTFDYVVLALPFAAYTFDYAQAGFDPLKLDAITSLGRGHNGKLQLQFNARGWNGAGPWPGIANGSSYSDTGYQCSWDVTRGQAGAPGILNLYSGGGVTDAMRTTTPFATAANAQVRADATAGLAQLAPVFPGLAWNGKATQSIWHKAPLFNASYAYYSPGSYTRFAGYEAEPQGGVYFCGEHTSLDYQGFMEGGAFTGVATGKALKRAIRNA
ncbi:MAG: FAD-dependent oxidoreductase [Myxococcales bacterium]|nr:FAD-dependent oxidoreductase [Myxococcales bacterium]MBK7193678.1 FAD-dependent oxidoreductase [Myxococcales bacterium]MBP6846777.1 FAD-dependent oxidoreductase [Kofleriaceae bacterium]